MSEKVIYEESLRIKTELLEREHSSNPHTLIQQTVQVRQVELIGNAGFTNVEGFQWNSF